MIADIVKKRITNKIYFKSEKARRFLILCGFVYTLRARRRPEGLARLHNGIQLLDIIVKVRFIKKVSWSEAKKELKDFVPYSGFKSISEWLNEVIRLNHDIPRFLYLYRVDVVREK